MKTLTLFICLAFLIINHFVVKSQTMRVWVVPEGTKNCGYVNENGDMVIDAQYTRCYEFINEGTALVKGKGQLYTYLIDTSGNEVTPEIEIDIYQEAYTRIPSLYNDGILRTLSKNKWGGLNGMGKIVVPYDYNELTNFKGGFAIGEKDDIYYVVDRYGNEKSIKNQNVLHAWEFSEGFAPIEVEGELFGYIDTLGRIAITPKYIRVGYFHGGYAWARNEDDMVGFINKAGEWSIEPMFKAVQDFDQVSGLAMARKEDDWGYVDTTGNIYYFKATEKTYSFYEGLAVGLKSEKFGYINNKGEWQIPPQYEAAHKFNNGHARVKKKGRWGLIDKQGNWVLQPIYKHVGEFSIID